MTRNTSPKYRCQKSPSGHRAFVELNGVRHYLGIFDSPESRSEYHRLLAEWSAAGQQLHITTDELTIIELAGLSFVKPRGFIGRRSQATAAISWSCLPMAPIPTHAVERKPSTGG